MGVLYMPFFNVADLGLGSIVLSTAGKSNATVNMSTITGTDEDSSTSSIMSHYLATNITSFDDEQVDRFRHYARTQYATALETAIRAAITAQSWSTPSNFNCDFSLVTGLITLSYSATFGVDWQSDPESALMLGFAVGLGGTPTNLSGANTYTGTKQPSFVINSTLLDVSNESGVYEPEGLGNSVENDTGSGNSLARTQAPLYNDWDQEFESEIKTYTRGSQYLLSSTWTHQDLYRHCRKGFPFVLYGDDRTGNANGGAEVYSLRSEGMSFHPQRMTPGSGTQFRIPYRCRLDGIAT